MDHKLVGNYWNDNAEAWTKLARTGYDMCRDCFNTTGFFEMLPDVNGLKGTELLISEVHRILRPGGFLQFSITHPYYDTLHRRSLRK
ncbi:MAG: hypothetical protein A2161_20315 [Candidatus Schekmanbacteria bacterium RBG_13_48_7]|uniref:Uncharacterized protein n=1 Tax=Candidatus Schekmanbacteria bacterium RBG_13_48_7 TaxID=1817878 RepID=A0A1F7RJ50_9BACT|nr:MAG: hypothetical protein A2161_20315 [Candidatus Schekmanbacteria bacterium RBG_13_48_7]